MLINVHVLPRSKKDEVIKQDNKNYRVRLIDPPVDNRANRELVALLAKYFGVSKNAVRIIRGLRSRNKIIEINQG